MADGARQGEHRGSDGGDPRRGLPSVEQVLHALTATGLPHALRALAAREAVDAARADIARGAPTNRQDVLEDASRRAAVLASRRLVPLVNATGVLLHTNL